MSLETVVTAIGFTILGFVVGKARFSSPNSEEKASAYKEIFDAFYLADRALSDASTEEELNGQLSEEIKKSAWDSMNSLGRVFARVRFILPQKVVDAMGELSGGNLGTTWSERLEELRRVKNSIYVLARKDVRAD